MNPYEADYKAKKAEYERVKSTVEQASKMTLTDEQRKNLLLTKSKLLQLERAYLAVKKQYDSYGTNPVETTPTNNTNKTTTTANKTPAVDNTVKSVSYTAPNGKQYTIKVGSNKTRFVGSDGTNKDFANEASAKAEIDKQNPKAISEVKKDESTAAVTEATGAVKEDLKTAKDIDTMARGEVLNKIQDVNVKQNLQTNIDNISTGFKAAEGHLKAAEDLNVQAENIYGQQQIDAQAADLIKKGMDPVRAKQASLFVNLKGRANLSAKIATIKSDYEKTLANLETQKAQLLNTAQNQGLENDKWIIDQTKSIESQIQNIKNNYQTNVLNLETTYTLKPLLDVASSNLAADAATVAQTIQAQYDTSTPERKIAALSKALGNEFAFIDGSIYNSINLPFEQLLVKAAEIIQANKVRTTNATK